MLQEIGTFLFDQTIGVLPFLRCRGVLFLLLGVVSDKSQSAATKQQAPQKASDKGVSSFPGLHILNQVNERQKDSPTCATKL